MKAKLQHLFLSVLLVLMGTSAWALEKKDNVYQIGSVDDFVAFAELVNSGSEATPNAELTADLVLPASAPMIGCHEYNFNGQFEGNGHTVTLNGFPSEGSGYGIFRNIGYHGWVRNLVVDGSVVSSVQHCGTVSAYCNGQITNCVSKVSIESSYVGDATVGGLTGKAGLGAVLVDNLSMTKVKSSVSTTVAGLVGWLDARVIMTNNLVIADLSEVTTVDGRDVHSISRNPGNIRYGRNLYLTVETQNSETREPVQNQITKEQLKNGEVCFMLNNDQSSINWTQNIGEDEYPVPFKTRKTVYSSVAANCSGIAEGAEYSNTDTGVEHEHHDYVNGKCQNCLYWDFDKVARADDQYYLLASAEDMEWWCARFDSTAEFQHGRMVADIDYSGHPLMLNLSNWYGGNFDGTGHTLTINFAYPEEEGVTVGDEYRAPFPHVYNGTMIQNLKVAGTIDARGKYASGIVGKVEEGDVLIENVVSDVAINSTVSGDGTHGGIVGNYSSGNLMIRNAVWTGSINSEATNNCGGIIGWTSHTQARLRNVISAGELNIADGDNNVVARNSNILDCGNVWYVSDPYGNAPSSCKQLDNPDDLGNGTLCYNINPDPQNPIFFQTLATDETPVPFKDGHLQVYANPSEGFRCDGTPLGNVSYSNTPSSHSIPDHQFHDGFCDVCSSFDADYKLPVNEDGFMEISTGRDLAFFAHLVSHSTEKEEKAVLVADIDMQQEDNDLMIPIGSELEPWHGHFNGQGHTIDGLELSRPTQNGMGLFAGFGAPNDTTIVENVILGENCVITGRTYVGVLGISPASCNNATQVIIRGVGNKGAIVATAQESGGILGCNMTSAATYTVENCFVTGTVQGGSNLSAISGWIDRATITNCWSSVKLLDHDGNDVTTSNYSGTTFCRFGGTTFNNCWDVYGTQENVKKIESEEWIAEGRLTWELNGKKFAPASWYQTIGDDEIPTIDPTHGVVYFIDSPDYGFDCVTDEVSFDDMKDKLMAFERAAVEDAVAQKTVLQAFDAEIEHMGESDNLDTLQARYDKLADAKKPVTASINAYKAFADKVAATLKYMEGNDQFAGEDRDALYAYLNSEDEPDETNVNGGAAYILEAGLLNEEELVAEGERIDEWLQLAIANGYVSGSDITGLIVNANCTDSFKGWRGVVATGSTYYSAVDMYGIEAWAKDFDMYQKIKVSKSGYYQFSVNGGYRPSNDEYSNNLIAQIYAGNKDVENVNLLPSVYESMQPAETAEDGVNCHLTGTTIDRPIREDRTNVESDTLGWAMHGQESVAIGAKAGRGLATVIAYVEEGDSLIIGIRNEGAKYDNDWTGFANMKLVYLGDAAEAAEGLAAVLENQAARAATLADVYEADFDNFAKGPNFSSTQREALRSLVAKVAETTDADAQMALIADFTKLFNETYQTRRSYLDLHNMATAIMSVSDQLMDILPEGQGEALYSDGADVIEGCLDGKYTEEAVEAKIAEYSSYEFVPAQDTLDVFQIENGQQLAYFSAYVNSVNAAAKAVVNNDLDMTGIVFEPIGHSNKPYIGKFDGQQHTFSNLNVSWGSTGAGLFGYVSGGADISKFILDNTCSIVGYANFAGVIGASNGSGEVAISQIGNEGSVFIDGANEAGGIIGTNEGSGCHYTISNCYVSGSVVSGGNTAAVAAWLGNKANISNVWSIATVEGAEGSNSFYRSPGEDNVPTLTNCYSSLNQQVSNLTKTAREDGSLTLTLNGNSSDEETVVWYQTLGTDTVPRLFKGDIVYKYDGEISNNKPVIELRSYAYDLATTSSAEEVEVAFQLNAPAKAGEIRFKDATSGEVVYTETLTEDALTAGQHAVKVANTNLGAAGTALTYEVAITAYGVREPRMMKLGQSVNGCYGMAVNTNPASANFGTVYASAGKAVIEDNVITKHAGIYSFTPLLETINEEAYAGGIALMDSIGVSVDDGRKTISPKELHFSEDGRFFVGVPNGLTTSSIYEADPEDLSKAWTPVLVGGELDEETGAIWIGEEKQGAVANSFTTTGSGENLKLLTLNSERSDGKNNATDYYGLVYNLGTNTSWNTIPSGIIDSLQNRYVNTPFRMHMVSDKRGGFWFVQCSAAATSKDVPSMKHYNAEGKEDYTQNMHNMNGGGMAYTADGKYFVFDCNGAAVFTSTYEPNAVGRIMLDAKFPISFARAPLAMAFDYAGNLYVATDQSQVVVYTLPNFEDKTADEVTVTPSSKRTNFTVGSDFTNIEDINAEDGAKKIYNLGGVRLQKTQKGLNIVDGKKVVVNE